MRIAEKNDDYKTYIECIFSAYLRVGAFALCRVIYHRMLILRIFPGLTPHNIYLGIRRKSLAITGEYHVE